MADKVLGSLKELKSAVGQLRFDGRAAETLRPVKLTRNYLDHVAGSVLVEFGKTKVICTAMVDEKVPMWLRGTGKGWLTAEYSMLPASTLTRKDRDISRGKLDGRSSEIQRLIGRALRNVVDLKALGERTLWIDCDVMQADGGTRTASITGAYVALHDACQDLLNRKLIRNFPLRDSVQAISVGKVGGKLLVDLCYEEDSQAEVDLNVVMTGDGHFIELQGTGESGPFTGDELAKLIELGRGACRELGDHQKKALGK
ncbi:MAG: ribonuclease PH [Planctomycetota bacterium]